MPQLSTLRYAPYLGYGLSFEAWVWDASPLNAVVCSHPGPPLGRGIFILLFGGGILSLYSTERGAAVSGPVSTSPGGGSIVATLNVSGT